MPRIDLKVPFAEKDEAKRLGARWDAARKVWFVPEGVDLNPLVQWLPVIPYADINVRSDSYFIAQTDRECWKCGKPTRVHSFVLPAEHEYWEPLELAEEDDEFEPGTEVGMWRRSGEQTIISYITDLAPAVAARIGAFAPRYRFGFDRTARASFWMNDCEHCGSRQGDHYLFEVTGAFCPVDEQAAARIVLHIVNEPFSGLAAERSLDVPLFHSMRCA